MGVKNFHADGVDGIERLAGLTREQKQDYMRHHNHQRDIVLTGGYDQGGMPAGGWKAERGFYLPKARYAPRPAAFDEQPEG